jgi:hypothetical protein
MIVAGVAKLIRKGALDRAGTRRLELAVRTLPPQERDYVSAGSFSTD